MRIATVVLVSLPFLAGCGLVDDVEAPRAFEFTGTFDPLTEEHPDLGGDVAVLTQSNTTTVSFAIHGLEPDSEVTWRLSQGVCDDPGDVVIDPEAFPPLEADAGGQVRTGDGQMEDSGENPRFIGELDPNTRYVVELFPGPTVEDDPIGCADLGEGQDPGAGGS